MADGVLKKGVDSGALTIQHPADDTTPSISLLFLSSAFRKSISFDTSEQTLHDICNNASRELGFASLS